MHYLFYVKTMQSKCLDILYAIQIHKSKFRNKLFFLAQTSCLFIYICDKKYFWKDLCNDLTND